MTLADWGYTGPAHLPNSCEPARVIGTWGDYYRIVCQAGEGVARKKASAYHADPSAPRPTTGDYVAVRWNPHGESRIFSTLPRTSVFERAATGSSGRRAQTVAVNFDTLFFLMSLNKNFNVRRLERFLALGRGTGADVVVLLTKCDLTGGPDTPETQAYFQEARAHAGETPIYVISAKERIGLDQLAPYVQPRRTLACVGSSGVGKSSLVNALAGEEIMPTLEIREWDAKGRHTTTERELVRLPSGVLVIDTPGMREIGLWEADAGIADTFSDIEALAATCRFSDCRHETEPGCAVKAARADGTISEDRWAAYRRLKDEAAHVERPKASSTHRYRR